jgi:negative regulator of sigma-B (phosphoserine phosphatase)
VGVMSDIEWAVASKPIPGEAVLGDAYLVAARTHGALLAVADGLGHGPEAAAAAERAVGTMKMAADEDIQSLLRRCDLALKQTRGAVLSLATIDFETDTLDWAGIGNVSGILLRRSVERGTTHRRLAPMPGVLGDKVRTPRTESNPLYDGDMLVFVTDGIVHSFSDNLEPLMSAPTQRIAQHILEQHWRGTDDALVLVVRYKGA